MLQSGPVTDYLAVLARDLGFDPALSRRVRGEVEDHLWQAADVRGGRSVENQLQAILSFGEPRELARGYLTASLLAQIRRAGAAMVFAAAAIYLAMKGRVAWYEWMRWEPNSDFTAVSMIALQIDRYATVLAILAATIACAYIATRRAPRRINTSYRKQLNRCIVLCSASAGAVVGVRRHRGGPDRRPAVGNAVVRHSCVSCFVASGRNCGGLRVRVFDSRNDPTQGARGLAAAGLAFIPFHPRCFRWLCRSRKGVLDP